MSTASSPESVSMEFQGPVPGLLGTAPGYHVVLWVQAGGGASFTRPSQEEREYYAQQGKPAPEWQCEYFEFDDVTWAEAPLTIELWCGSSKLRSLFLAGRKGRREAEVGSELPELARFLQNHGLSLSLLAPTFRDALLRAAESAGVIRRGVAAAPQRARTGAHRHAAASEPVMTEPWWRRLLGRVRRQRLGAA